MLNHGDLNVKSWFQLFRDSTMQFWANNHFLGFTQTESSFLKLIEQNLWPKKFYSSQHCMLQATVGVPSQHVFAELLVFRKISPAIWTSFFNIYELFSKDLLMHWFLILNGYILRKIQILSISVEFKFTIMIDFNILP